MIIKKTIYEYVVDNIMEMWKVMRRQLSSDANGK